jgi:hypothetical protein
MELVDEGMLAKKMAGTQGKEEYPIRLLPQQGIRSPVKNKGLL